jgi:antitoxin ParD1/3/4
MNVNLTPALEEYVQQKVASGDYNNASEVIREALRFLKERDMLKEAKLRDLRAMIEEGINSGEPMEWDKEEIKRRGRAILEDQKRKQLQGA